MKMINYLKSSTVDTSSKWCMLSGAATLDLIIDLLHNWPDVPHRVQVTTIVTMFMLNSQTKSWPKLPYRVCRHSLDLQFLHGDLIITLNVLKW